MATPSPSSDITEEDSAAPSLGRYTLLTKLATGGMAEIFLARQQGSMGFEKLVVIKRILDSYAEDPDFVSMFLDEARIASQLSHPNIVQIFDLGEEGGTYYIAMEYLAGESLATVARTAAKSGEPLPLAYAVKLIADAAEALGYAHNQVDAQGEPLNIVHRDVSPHNLFVTYSGSLKVLDFGIAKAANRATRTVGNQVKGTMAYMSPEQVQGREVDARADVFALGIVLFEAVTRSRLFQRDEPGAVYGAVVGPEPIPLASERNPDVDPELDQIIAQALQRDRDQRFASAHDLRDALEAWLRQVQAPTTGDLSAYMHGLFEERIAKRAQLMERAQRGEEISTITFARRQGTSGSGSMPGQSMIGEAPAPASRTGLWIALAVAGGVAVIGGAALYGAMSTSPRALAPVVVPPPKPTRIMIDTDPPHADVIVDGMDKGAAPVTVSGLALGDHDLKAKAKAGDRPDATRTISLESPGQEMDVLLRLAAPPTAAPAPPTPAPEPAPEAPPPPQPAPTKPVEAVAAHPSESHHHAKLAPEPSPTPAPAPAGSGRLTLDTTPWTQVYEGATNLGMTPLAEVKLSSGTHELRLVNPDQKIARTIEVVIHPDQTTVTKLHF